MSHEIANIKGQDQFITRREPAWHELGEVFDAELTATQASEKLILPDVVSEPVITSSGLVTKHKAIVGRVPDTEPVVYDVVSNLYHEISHKDFIRCWDAGTDGQTIIETMGLLYKGSTLFLTTKLPSFGVKGDEVIPYLLAFNPLKSGKAATVRKTPVRVVCNNTLQASGMNFSQEWKVIHTSDAALQMTAFIREMWGQAVQEYETIKDLYEILASTKLSDDQVRDGFAQVYPDPVIPQKMLARASTDPVALAELAAWEREKKYAAGHRDECFRLYSGEGIGSTTEAALGTAWGAYNGIVEYEQYLKKYARPESVVFGAGRDRIVTGFKVMAELAGVAAGSEESESDQ